MENLPFLRFAAGRATKKSLHPEFVPNSRDKSQSLCGATLYCRSERNRPLAAHHHVRSDITVGDRQRLLAEAFRLPSRVHSAICAPPQSHHLRLSACVSRKRTSLVQRFYFIALKISQNCDIVNRELKKQCYQKKPNLEKVRAICTKRIFLPRKSDENL